MAQIVLKPRKARPFYGRHPWVLDSAVDRVEGTPADGDVVDLLSEKGKFIARGIFNSQSRIRVRLYSWDSAQALDEAFWRGRIANALRLRKDIGYDAPRGAARLVFSEADGLSGLIVDRYGPHLSIQITAQAMAVRLEQIVAMLVELTDAQSVVLRTERGISRAEGLDLHDGPYWGTPPDGPFLIQEHGLQFAVDLAEGQKTGMYLDQRENRLAAASYFRGRRVLDMFCYTGGFSLAAAVAGAKETLGVDSSAKAIALAEANAQRNGVAGARFQIGDGFETLQALLSAGERFDAIVLDPPKFARSRRALDDALRAYHWLNRLAVELLNPGGILVTCSCSGHVAREDFRMMLLGVAQQTRRDIQILQERGAAADHPVAVTCLEGEYLKCFVCRLGERA